MDMVIFIVVLLLLLLLMKAVFEPLHAIIYVMLFFLAFSLLLSSMVLPFAHKLLDVLPNIPYGKQIVFSAVLYFIGDQLKHVVEELEYKSLASMLQTSIRVVIMLYWVQQLSDVLEAMRPFMEWIL